MSTCSADNRPPPVHKNPTVTDTIRKFVQQMHKLAWDEANSRRDASPEKLVHLSGIKYTEKAFVITKDLLVEQIYSSLLDVSMSEQQRKELLDSVVNQVENKIEELMQKPRYDIDSNESTSASSAE